MYAESRESSVHMAGTAECVVSRISRYDDDIVSSRSVDIVSYESS